MDRNERRRILSDTSGSSVNTQMTNVSQESQPGMSPGFSKYGGPEYRHPTFFVQGQGSIDYGRQNSIDNGHQFANNLIHSQSDLDSRVSLNNMNFEARRAAAMRARRTNVGRRQSESVITEHHERRPPCRCHTTTCMANGQSMIDGFDDTLPKYTDWKSSRESVNTPCLSHFQCSQDFDNRYIPMDNTRRAKSNGALDSIHRYEIPYQTHGQFQRRDTEVSVNSGNPGHIVRLAGTRRDPSLSGTPPELLTDAPAVSETDPGYTRHTLPPGGDGFCQNLSFYINKHAVKILTAINVILLAVIFAGVPYVVLKLMEKPTPGKPPLYDPSSACFTCSDVTKLLVEEGIQDGHFTQEGNTCCFGSAVTMTTWLAKKMASERPFVYLTGNDVQESNGEHKIQWSESPTAQLELTNDKTEVVLQSKGFYFVFSRIHYKANFTKNESNSDIAMSHSLRKKSNGGEPQPLASVSLNLSAELIKARADHSSGLETIAFFQPGDTVYVEVQVGRVINKNKEQIFGLFRIA